MNTRVHAVMQICSTRVKNVMTTRRNPIMFSLPFFLPLPCLLFCSNDVNKIANKEVGGKYENINPVSHNEESKDTLTACKIYNV